MRALLLLPLLLAACVGNISGAPAERALAGRTVVFGPEGATKDDTFWQEWRADGTTRTGGPSVFHDKTGRWKTDGSGRYCEIFGVSTEWTCWRVTLGPGDQVRFWEIPGEVADLLIFHKDMTGHFLP